MGDTGGKRECDGGGDADDQSARYWREYDRRVNAWIARYLDNRVAWKRWRSTDFWCSITVSRRDRKSSSNKSE